MLKEAKAGVQLQNFPGVLGQPEQKQLTGYSLIRSQRCWCQYEMSSINHKLRRIRERVNRLDEVEG